MWCDILLYIVGMSYCNKQFDTLLDVHNECENLDVNSYKGKIDFKSKSKKVKVIE